MERQIAVNRFGLGARGDEAPPADPRGWLIAQIARYNPAPAQFSALAGTGQLLTRYGELTRAARDARMNAPPEADPPSGVMAADQARQPMKGPLAPLREHYVASIAARMAACAASPAPFAERLAIFWANHFAISAEKVQVVLLAGAFEREAIRPHVFGKFGDMLRAVTSHPAMLGYLDQAQSTGPNSARAQRAAGRNAPRTPGLNENLAREILELHTLGVRSGYSQADVGELARALTGWTAAGLRPAARETADELGFRFFAAMHEPGARNVLGKRYAEGGEEQARAILDDLAVHPATARHIATKLARHFCADVPPPSLVARLERTFLETGGDLGTVSRALIAAPEPWAETAPKFRTPWDWAVAIQRAAPELAVPGGQLIGMLGQLGQPVWKPGSPAGWDDTAATWAAPDALLRRVELSSRLARRAGPLDARKLAGALFPDALGAATRSAIAAAASPAEALALLLVSPEMLRR